MDKRIEIHGPTHTATKGGATPFRISSIEQLPQLAQDETCQIIKQYFDYLENTLSRQDSAVDTEQLNDMLNEVSGFIRSDKSQLRADGYSRMLKRLNSIYAQGLRINDNRAFTRTAVNFADILNTVSQSFPSYDYSESVGLLLHYMHKMFNYREEGWIEVLEHLIAMPDSVEIMQLIKSQHLEEIQNWVEEGVDNLFALLDEQLEVIDNIDSEILLLDNELLHRRRALSKATHTPSMNRVVPISRIREKQLIQELFGRRAELMSERAGKLELADLLDENIQEFTDRLIEIRRSALVQLVWENPDKP
jgi:ribosomal protein L17